MPFDSTRFARAFLCVRSFLPLILATALCGIPATPARAQGIDASINATVWKMLYGVTDAQLADPSWLAADDDGDGVTNGAELAAGTNPFKAGSTLAVTSLTTDGTNVSVGFPTMAGKLYVLQSTTNLVNPAGWAALSPNMQTAGDGSTRTLTAPQAGPNAFYRILVQDVDTDGDGVSDWAERVVGYDPTNTHSHGAAQDDRTALTAALAAENVVTITATEATATQPADAMTAATDTATFTISRGGTLNFAPLTVPLSWSGTAASNVDYAALPGSVTFPVKVNTITLTVVPLANPSRLTGATVTGVAQPGGGYQLGAASSASVAINPSGSARGTGLTASYYQEPSSPSPATYTALLFDPSRLKVARVDPTVDFVLKTTAPLWPPTATDTGAATGLNTTYFVARWEGQVQPQYSETYYFDTLTDDGVKLWVNDQLVSGQPGTPLIDGWSYQSTDRVSSIALRAGVLYDIRMEYYQGTGSAQAHLYWYSDSQTKQIIPSSRLYPKAGTQAPPAITSAAQAIGFVGQPFTFAVTASNTGGTVPTFALGANSGPLPPGLTLNATTGVISGTPTAAGDFPVAITATNTLGKGAAVLDIQILATGNGVTREIWNNLTGSRVADIPLTTAPTSTDTSLVTLEDTATLTNNTGERLRGYFTAPATGNYYFWIAANNAAEFWLSNDAEPVNKIRRAALSAPSTTPRAWNAANRSPWLSLIAGERYYYEVLHHTGTGGGVNLAVGWFLDPTGTTASPTVGVVPGYVLNRYDYPAAIASSGTLYATNLSPQGAASSKGTGSANLRMNPGNTQAILHFSYAGLSSPRTAYHVHVVPSGDASGSGPIVFDIDDADKFHPEQRTPDGGYLWTIQDVGALTAAQIVSALQDGRAYLNVHTVSYPNGEIRGNFGLVQGSQIPPAPVPDPGFAGDSASAATVTAAAARFLNQAAYGAGAADLTAVAARGYAGWLDDQFDPVKTPPTHLLDDVNAHLSLDPMNVRDSYLAINAWWRAAVNAPDQLRQRVAFALSEILVVSDSNATLADHGDGMASYYDVLVDNGFGNFRDLLKAATLHPTMGYWLNMQGNPKGSLSSGLHPNENYAREIMQLFSIGLNRQWPDGTLVLDSQGNLVPTYGQDEISGFARVFTGWNWNQANQGNGRLPTSFNPPSNYVSTMTLVPTQHELGPKQLLNRVVLPAATGYNPPAAIPAGTEADPSTAAFDAYCTNDLDKAIDNIVAHPNVGPYVCRQLIQRLVESNPSPAYLQRVVQRWEDDGSPGHVRGNLKEVIRAILLDGEARNVSLVNASATAGKQREPIMRIAAPARTFPFKANAGTFNEAGTQAFTVTTDNPHRLAAGDFVGLDFKTNVTTDVPPVEKPDSPTSTSYKVESAPTATTFTVNAPGLPSYGWTQAANSSVLTVSVGGTSALQPVTGQPVYLYFANGAVPNGFYTVNNTSTVNNVYYFTITTPDTPTAARNSSVLVYQLSGSYTITGSTGAFVLKFIFYNNHNLKVGDKFWTVLSSSTQVKTGEWTVTAVLDKNTVKVDATSATLTKTETGNTVYHYPEVAPPLTRNGKVALAASKFDMKNTNGSLGQSPLDAPTVFNFFYPDYLFPGTLARANVTTPEFQLTTDTNVINLTNTINSTILGTANNQGLSSFSSGAILLDLGDYMATKYAGSGNTQLLVDDLDARLTGGMMSAGAKAAIVSFLNNTTNFPTNSTTAARDKARGAVQLILSSPEYAVQR